MLINVMYASAEELIKEHEYLMHSLSA